MVNLDSFGKGTLNIGSGARGAHDAFVQTGTMQLDDYLFVSNSHVDQIQINGTNPDNDAHPSASPAE